MATKSFDSDLVRSLAELLDQTNLTEIEYDTGTLRIRVARQGMPVAVHHMPAAAPAVAAAPVAQPAVSDDAAGHPGAVTSPMVGVSYLSPEPGAAKFIDVGSTVSEGQTLMLIEAMKTFNPIRAPRGGKVTRILVTDGQPVEFGEPLVIIE
ncbi:biotin/lipoyl-containing protein [Magnetospirillum sp. 64-120]|uniref:acetyl-CoA carboxylase biotin carboxyl carrier protein n=1 Tax=Magnetospirillum sp. 64-120 TaxID=1895778 RepID=UPI00092CBD3D|nr:biotin/lipoyl-containing protein [Magnetospirillum sp. 64-120]OJX79338.1 MAG: acetyl-CoA carboxylase biotin carboxyl carrier protein subunit [Magnetospirillum sp. 64-120]